MAAPERQWCRSFPSAESIGQLLKECEKHKISDTTVVLLRRLAARKPRLRLAVNLHMCLSAAIDKDLDNILVDGLWEDERRALIELDTSAVPPPLREVAHGLLNVHERWVLWRSLARSFRTAEAAKDHLLDDGAGG